MTLKAKGCVPSARPGGSPVESGAHPALELLERLGARARDRLVGRGHHLQQPRHPRQRSQRHHDPHGRAIGVGDEPRPVRQQGSVHLRDHQRDVLVVAEGAAVVHDHRARSPRHRHPLLRQRVRDRREDHVEAREGLSRDRKHRCLPAPEAQGALFGSATGQQPGLVHREGTLVQQSEHGPADESRRAQDAQAEVHRTTEAGVTAPALQRLQGRGRMKAEGAW